MPVYQLNSRPVFPPTSLAEPDGLLAVGGDLSPERLIAAYRSGIFPWPHDGYPLLWFSPNPRLVLRPAELHVPRRLARVVAQGRFDVRLDNAFEQVIAACASVPRRHEPGTWITPAMQLAYTQLHRLGYAHSAEAWRDGELVGGLYGVAIGGAFIGESMFARVSEASKVAFVTLARQLDRWGFVMVDAQVHTEHLARFGAREVPRRQYLALLDVARQMPDRLGKWTLEPPRDA